MNIPENNESIETINLEESQNLTITLGFTAGLKDLTHDPYVYVQPPEEKPLIVLDLEHVSRLKMTKIDSLKLLSNYNRHKPPHNIKEILEKLGLQKYVTVFEEHEVDIETFKILTLEDLQEMGIKDEKITEKLLQVADSLNDFQNKSK